MAEMYAYLFPGQGSQAIGMGQELVASYPAAREVFAEADDALGFSLSRLCAEGPADELARTAITQPAILTCSIAALRVLEAECGIVPKVALGHSLGEFSALVAAGALTFADAVRIVRIRGEAMQQAVPEGVGAMAAILGLTGDVVEELCHEASEENASLVSPANENGGGQIVVAGHADAVARLVSLAKSRKGRAIPLRVSAPFHCALMQPAAERLAQALADVNVASPRIPVIANVDAKPNSDASRIKSLLVEQVTSRVKWEASIQCAVDMGVDRGLEIGHGRVLAGLVKRIAPSLTVNSVGSTADIDVLKDGFCD